MARVCLITTGQPSTNPRLVKEADALTEAGHEVSVICAYWTTWADEMDQLAFASRRWKESCLYVGGHPKKAQPTYLWTRLRSGVSRRIPFKAQRLSRSALGRVVPELIQAARKTEADLFIAHNPGALPAAVAGASAQRALVGFDAEDFHCGMSSEFVANTTSDSLVKSFERRFLPKCDYVTAASPGIAKAYSEAYGLAMPVSILNVFPLSDRPKQFRETSDTGPLTLYWFSQTIGPNRGLEDALRAMGRLGERSIELHLRGQWQAGYDDRIQRLAQDCGVRTPQIIVHKPASPEEMVRLASSYDVGLALESRISRNSDLCISNKIFVHLLAGCALAASKTEGQESVIRTVGTAGALYEPGNVDALACQLKTWHQNRSTLALARKKSWEWGTRRYNWDVEKKQFLNVVNTVLGNAGPNANSAVA